MITNKNCRFSKGGGNYLRLLIAALISFGAVAAWAQEPVPVEDHSTITTYEDENILSSDLSLRRLNVNGNSVYIFTNAASAQVVKAKRGIVLLDCLLVGGGGGGGCSRAGGGGGGGVTNATDIVGAYIDRDDTFTLANASKATVPSLWRISCRQRQGIFSLKLCRGFISLASI